MGEAFVLFIDPRFHFEAWNNQNIQVCGTIHLGGFNRI